MRYFDCHTHLPSADVAGFNAYLDFLRVRPDLVGSNLVLNSSEETKLVAEKLHELPSKVTIIPALPLEFEVPPKLTASRWWKIHPALHHVTRSRIPEVIRLLASLDASGVMVHHFPWGDRMEHNTGLDLVLEVARAFPDLPVLATHGGGYESWQLRAHTARLSNVYYDFSVTFAVYDKTDHLKPWSQYVQRRRNRIVFGSDWPSAEPEPQLAVAVSLAQEVGVGPSELERHLLENSTRLWLPGSNASSRP